METNNWAVDKKKETTAEFQDSGKSTGNAQYGKRASECFDQSADYVRQFDYKQTDARERIRKLLLKLAINA